MPSSDALVTRLEQVLHQPLAASGVDLEAVEVQSVGKSRVLRVAVDKDGGVSLDDIADVTREVSGVLDESDVMGAAPYTLEVGSPGVDRPLTHPRHWRRNHDRLVKVTIADGSTFTGRVVGNDEQQARLDVSGRERVVDLDDVRKARVQIEFKRKE